MESILQLNKVDWKRRLLISTPTLGLIRYEWHNARSAQIIPVNWQAFGFDPMGYSVDDAYNLIVNYALFVAQTTWLMTIEDDVILPPDAFKKMSQYLDSEKIPIVSGLYTTKSLPAEPLVFRGRGNGSFYNWKQGDKVWCDGLPMGFLLIHTSILRWFWDNTEEYQVHSGEKIHRVFETPKKIWFNPETGEYARQEGTQDLYFFDRIMEYEVLKKTGWKQIARRKYPFLCDTSIFCKHIDRMTGKQYPIGGLPCRQS